MPRAGILPTNRLRRRSSVPCAFTLIELLASTVLAAMLMLAIVGLLRATSAHSRAAEQMLETHPPTSILSEQLRRDLVNARHIEIRPNRVRLSGYLARDLNTGRQTFRAAEVTYAVVTNGRGNWLVRRETQSSPTAGRRARLDVAWFGAAALEVVRFDDSEGESPDAPAPPGMTHMPAHLIVSICDREGKTVCSEEIFHHHNVQ